MNDSTDYVDGRAALASTMPGTEAPAGLTPPAGFEALSRSSPFLQRVGPLLSRRDARGQLVLGMFVLAHHCNAGGTAHGGMLSTLADVALGYATAFSQEPAVPMTTVSLRLDFVGAAHLGDWIEVHTQVGRIGRRLAFASASMTVEGQLVASGSAVFQVHAAGSRLASGRGAA